ncbi:dTMP kinase [Streptomyces sp. AJS327]|uniref:dTMP kinase n=1 Tax=Streptomyces sp. AJS327 TaxID=2545265 RepID=UPI0015DE94AD|nr:dTMP kinase [Streptomyces sp. AJS327]MBA0053043.1 dTMP kinase [Streptomyces sp. AJS327]
MTRAEQPTGVTVPPDDALAAQSRERAVGALLRFPPLRRLWSAQFTGGVGDALSVLVLLLLGWQAAVIVSDSGSEVFGGGYRGMVLVLAAVIGLRLLSTLLFGAVLLGPLSALVEPGRSGGKQRGASGEARDAADGAGDSSGEGAAAGKAGSPASRKRGTGVAEGKALLDRRWTMFGADAVRVIALIIAPLWVDWTPDNALAAILITVFVTGVAERLWTVAKDSAAPGLLPGPPPEGDVVRPVVDHHDALRRLWLRTSFVAFPVAAAVLVAVTLVSNLLGSGIAWFDTHQAALSSYVAAGLFAASLSVVYFLELPDTATVRPRSPLEGLRRPKAGASTDRGRTGAVPLLVLACAATSGALAAAVAVALPHAVDLDGGPVAFGLAVLALTGGATAGIRLAPRTLPALSRRRLLALAVAATGVALLVAGLVGDPTTVLILLLLGGVTVGITANTGHTLLDQETEDFRRPRTTEHLHAVVRLTLAVCALGAPVLAAFIGPHRVARGDFVFDHGGAAFTLMLVGALLLPVAALVLGRVDDRQGVSLRRDLRNAFGGAEPVEGTADDGFFIVLEGGDGAGKSTQVTALAEWIRAKGHEVVVTKEPGSTPVGKRLRSILLDVSSAGLSPRSEALLYAADRAEHVDTVVRPALERGAIVISDRYVDSSVAYQGAGRDLSPTEIARISRWATGGLVPHLTVLLDVAPQVARERFTEAPDRLESEPTEFHERARAGFLTLASADPARYLVVDAGQEAGAVTTIVRHRLDQVLPLSEAEKQAQIEARKAAEEEARRRAEEEAARKAEEERQERERQERIAQLRAEEEERKRREAELERQREEARRAEEARQRAEEERQRAEEERLRREAEERAREEEQARLRQLAQEQARLRAEAEERRLEKQRKAEEALLRAERVRSAGSGAGPDAAHPDGSEGDTAKLPSVEGPRKGAGAGASGGSNTSAGSDGEETALLPQAQPPGERADAAHPDGSEETTVLPRVPEDATDRDADQAADRWTADRWSDEQRDAEQRFLREGFPAAAVEERTREMPQVDPETGRPVRQRPDWAEETPLDDVPSLADELLGPRGERDEDGDRRRGRADGDEDETGRRRGGSGS